MEDPNLAIDCGFKFTFHNHVRCPVVIVPYAFHDEVLESYPLRKVVHTLMINEVLALVFDVDEPLFFDLLVPFLFELPKLW